MITDYPFSSGMKSSSAVILLAGMIANAGFAYSAQAAGPTGSVTDPRDLLFKPGDLRGLYQVVGDPAVNSAGIGRLILQHIVDGQPQEVSRHHRFRTGDRFRFLVSANRAGWLYVLHRMGNGPVQQLWPRDSGMKRAEPSNRLQPHQAMQVPPSGVAFAFDDEVGMEHFYVTIVSEPRPPSLSAVTETDMDSSAELDHPTGVPEAKQFHPGVQSDRPPSIPVPSSMTVTQASAANTVPQIIQFSVRGPGTGKVPMRGVVLDPDPQQADTATYFSLLPDDKGDALVFEFQLLHQP